MNIIPLCCISPHILGSDCFLFGWSILSGVGNSNIFIHSPHPDSSFIVIMNKQVHTGYSMSVQNARYDIVLFLLSSSSAMFQTDPSLRQASRCQASIPE